MTNKIKMYPPINRLDVLLHQMGYNTKRYQHYVEFLQDQLYVNFFDRVLKSELLKFAEQHPCYGNRVFQIVNYFPWECARIYLDSPEYLKPYQLVGIMADEYLK